MPTPETLRPIQRVPSGLSGPGGTGSSPCAHGESGGVQVGSTTLLMMWKLPVGVGYADWPTATPNTIGAWPGRISVSECEDSSITMRVVSAPIVVRSA